VLNTQQQIAIALEIYPDPHDWDEMPMIVHDFDHDIIDDDTDTDTLSF
jgi:hypothetical protein